MDSYVDTIHFTFL